MTEILSNWIQNRLGIIINTEEKTLVSHIRDGTLITNILLNYMLITDEEANLVLQAPKDEDSIVKSFQTYIRLWLKKINILLTDVQIDRILRGKNYESVHLLYEIYLELKDLSFMNICTQNRLRERFRDESIRFHVTPVPESDLDNFKLENHPSTKMLEENYDVIHWHKDRLDIILQKCRDARETYFNIMRKNCKISVVEELIRLPESDKELKCDDEVQSLHEAYCELIKQAEHSKDIKILSKDLNRARKMMQKYTDQRLKTNLENAEKEVQQSNIAKQVTEDLMNLIRDQDDKMINQRLLEQSYYEKQMVKTLADVKMQKDMIINNKRIVTELLQDKRDKHFIDNLMMISKNKDEKKLEYYIEKERLVNLHRRIYAERQRLKAERTFNMCLDAVSDMAEIAMDWADYKQKYEKEPTRRTVDSWKGLFVKGGLNFGETDVELQKKIIRRCGEDEDEEEYELIIGELEKQDLMDDRDFENYMEFIYPFDVDHAYSGNEETMYHLECGENVLGYIIYRLLTAKYPKPTFRKANLSKCKVAACINGLPDNTTLPILQKLLSLRKILVVEMKDVVNFCLEAYKKETTEDYPDKVLIEETNKTMDKKKGKKDKGKKKGEKKPNKKDKKKDKSSSGSEIDLPRFQEKLVQTPIIYPGEEIKLSMQADLGKIAHEQMSLGNHLPDFCLVEMLMVYLELQKDFEGFALINYPVTYQQAALLEESLSGVPVPPLEIDEEKMLEEDNFYNLGDFEKRIPNIKKDPFEDIRTSKLLKNPLKPVIDPLYDTFFTAYIRINYIQPNDDGELEIPPIFDILEDNPDPLEKFYADLGCNYQMYYRNFDLNTIKYLGKLIIGEYTIPPKKSIELFGDTVTYIEAEYASGKGAKGSIKGKKKDKPKDKKKKGDSKSDKKSKDKSSKSSSKDKKEKKEKKEKKGKKGKKGEEDKVVIVHEDKVTQAPEESEEEPSEEPKPEPRPGETDWEYVDLGLPTELAVCLATLWETAEKIYVVDFKQLFYLKRIVIDAVVPYCDFCRKHMYEIVTRPDNKQQYVHDFQRTYNEFDNDFRSDDEFKMEMHMRITEMKEALFDICDNIMLDSEKERQRMISENWTSRQLIEMYNIVTNFIQLELDRCVDTMQVVNDYYTCLVTKMPSDLLLPKIIIVKLTETNHEEIVARLDEEIMEGMRRFDAEFDDSRIETMLNVLLDNSVNFVTTTLNLAKGVMEKVKEIFKPKKGGKEKTPRKQPTKKGAPDTTNILKLFEPEQIAIDNHAKISDEWETALDGEFTRVKIRLDVLKVEALSQIQNIFLTVQQVFHTIYSEIKERYQKEIEAVETICQILQRAIEMEIPLQQQLNLSGDTLLIKNLKLFPDPIIIPEPPKEVDVEYVFTAGQLNKLVDILFDLAPSGYIIEQSFKYLLQDIISYSPEDGTSLAPPKWCNLQPRDIDFILAEQFDPISYIDWKSFILIHSMIRFPNIEEIMLLRQEFRSHDPDALEYVTDYQYKSIRFWYENCEQTSALRTIELKKIFFRMYKIKGDYFNYTAFLLDLCRDSSAVMGFAKALSVSLGKIICWSKPIGEKFVEIVREDRRAHEEMKNLKEIEMETENMDEQMPECESLIIEDYHSTDTLSGVDIDFVPNSTLPLADHIEDYINQTYGTGMFEEDSSHFSNVEIGFQDKGVPNLAYFLPFELLLTTLAMTVTWHLSVVDVNDKSLKERIEEIYERCKTEEFNDKVLCHQFLLDPEFLEIISGMKKFLCHNPICIIQSLI